MGMTNAKQELWAKTMIALLKTKLVAEAICNPSVVLNAATSKFHIIGAGEVTVTNYDEDTDISYQDPSDTDTEFTFNLDKYFGVMVKDTDVNQTEISWESIYADRGAYGCVKALDASVFADHAAAGLDNYETGTTPWQLGSAGADVPALFASVGAQLDAADAPQEGRYIVLPPAGIQAIRLYGASKNSSFGDQVLMNGMVGNFMGFSVFMSNNLTTVTTTIHGLAGVARENVAWKMQIDPSSIEQIRAQGRFANLIRGRIRAGHKVYRAGTLIDVNLNTTLLA
jgi:hypothetical protein